MAILFHAEGWGDRSWVDQVRAALPGRKILTLPELADPAEIEYALLWKSPADLFEGMTGLKVIFSLGAGVDHLVGIPQLPKHVPLVRVVDPDLTDRMSEYIVMHCLIYQRRLRLFDLQQKQHLWRADHQCAAKEVRIGILGLGELGLDAARKLKTIGFQVNGWSRSQKHVTGINSYNGSTGLDEFLGNSDILVSLLPLTDATRGIINRQMLEKLARDGVLGGPFLINAGRGGLQVEADIMSCLDDGTLQAATLDVFETEPLSASSPLWDHPKLTISPHNAAESDARSICSYIAAQIEAFEAGRELKNLVQLDKGY